MNNVRRMIRAIAADVTDAAIQKAVPAIVRAEIARAMGLDEPEKPKAKPKAKRARKPRRKAVASPAPPDPSPAPAEQQPRRTRKPTVSDAETAKVIAAIADAGKPIRAVEICQVSGIEKARVSVILRLLVHGNHVVTEGVRRGTRYRLAAPDETDDDDSDSDADPEPTTADPDVPDAEYIRGAVLLSLDRTKPREITAIRTYVDVDDEHIGEALAELLESGHVRPVEGGWVKV